MRRCQYRKQCGATAFALNKLGNVALQKYFTRRIFFCYLFVASSVCFSLYFILFCCYCCWLKSFAFTQQPLECTVQHMNFHTAIFFFVNFISTCCFYIFQPFFSCSLSVIVSIFSLWLNGKRAMNVISFIINDGCFFHV